MIKSNPFFFDSPFFCRYVDPHCLIGFPCLFGADRHVEEDLVGHLRGSSWSKSSINSKVGQFIPSSIYIYIHT